jgi:crotonyl-CoA carboxylase/reductase
MKRCYPLAEAPELGVVPPRMLAQVIRRERYGEPRQAFQVEEVEVPAELAPDEVLVYVMAAGINYNCVWAGLGHPVDIIESRRHEPDYRPFHIGGSDAAGIVWAVGSGVTDLSIGDPVVIHCGTWRAGCPVARATGDPMFSPTFRIWGFETNWGSFAQFTRVQAHQCLPKPERLTWEEAAAYMLVGATAYRMLAAWPPHTVQPNDVVLVWGGAGGLGCFGIQIAREMGGIPIAVVSSDDKAEFCRTLGAHGCINRTRFDHWGAPPRWNDGARYSQWLKQARAFGSAIWEILGERRNPRIVFEHPGEDTLPTSMFVCDPNGMVVICGGTSGYSAGVDLRYLWMRQKRLQGSHFANDTQAAALNRLVADGRIQPCLSATFGFDEIPDVHQRMYENQHPHGKMACLVNAPRPGLTTWP